MEKLNSAWNIYYKLASDVKDVGLYDIYYKISMAIFKFRDEHNLTQKQLAKSLGITQAMVSKLESGVYNYTIEQLWKISSKLGLEFDVKFQKQTEQKPVWYLDNIKVSDPLVEVDSRTRGAA